jgi:hypothetical protein
VSAEIIMGLKKVFTARRSFLPTPYRTMALTDLGGIPLDIRVSTLTASL